MHELLSGAAVGKIGLHIWIEGGEVIQYHAKLVKVKNRPIKKGQKKVNVPFYTVAYWTKGSTFEDATDEQHSMYILTTDFLYGDLIFP